MGKPTSSSADLAVAISEANLAALNAVTPGVAFTGLFNLKISGAFSGTVIVESSFDGGTTWVPNNDKGVAVSFTAPTRELLRNPEAGVLSRVKCIAFANGIIEARLSQ